MVVTTRTFTWIGFIILLISLITLSIIILNAPPVLPLIGLFIGYAGLAVFGASMVIISLIQRMRGDTVPTGTLRRSTIAGLTAIALLILQYQDLLALPLALIIILGSIILETGISLYMHRQDTAPEPKAKTRSSSPTPAHTRGGSKKRTKS